MVLLVILTLIIIALFVKKGDDLATILKKVATGILLFFVPILIFVFLSAVVNLIKGE
jgi:hypothetical protein